jgi:hypothetical protein
MYWLLGRKSKLSISNKLLACKIILKPIWAYEIKLWGSASISSMEILELFQVKVLRMITDAAWYVPNTVLRQDLQVTSVKEEIHRFSTQYRARLYTHPNNLTVHLTSIVKQSSQMFKILVISSKQSKTIPVIDRGGP